MSNNKHWSAKERIEYLLDENSFVEIGALVTKRNTDFNLTKGGFILNEKEFYKQLMSEYSFNVYEFICF